MLCLFPRRAVSASVFGLRPLWSCSWALRLLLSIVCSFPSLFVLGSPSPVVVSAPRGSTASVRRSPPGVLYPRVFSRSGRTEVFLVYDSAGPPSIPGMASQPACVSRPGTLGHHAPVALSSPVTFCQPRLSSFCLNHLLPIPPVMYLSRWRPSLVGRPLASCFGHVLHPLCFSLISPSY